MYICVRMCVSVYMWELFGGNGAYPLKLCDLFWESVQVLSFFWL